LIITDDYLYLANVGDSEAVLYADNVAHILSVKHVPSDEAEKSRVEAVGGRVVWYGTWRVNGILSVSRSIGDNHLDGVVIPDPAITVQKRSPHDQFVILGTDGLWDVIKHQEACNFVLQQTKVQEKKNIAQSLLDEAMNRKSKDNISIVILFFD